MPENRILLKGRLGNQMFIYAFARALKTEKNITPILIDDWLLDHNVSNRLDCFALSQNVRFGHGTGMSMLRKSILFVAVKFLHNTKRIKRHELEIKMAPLLSRFGIYYITDGYHPMPSTTELHQKDFYMEGYFQSVRYFEKCREDILADFQFLPSLKERCSAFAEIIRQSTEPTCLHVRLGDYVNHYLHGIANVTYYHKALKALKAIKPNAQIFLFSDNISLAKQELNLSDDILCLPENCDDQQTMYLGSLCKNFIISNSSFSWWMQYLSNHQDKIVFAPRKWYAQDIPCEIYLDTWRLIDVS